MATERLPDAKFDTILQVQSDVSVRGLLHHIYTGRRRVRLHGDPLLGHLPSNLFLP